METQLQSLLQITQTRLSEVGNKLIIERDTDKAKRLKKENLLLQKLFGDAMKLKEHLADKVV